MAVSGSLLDLDTVQAFVTVAELGSFTRAAEACHLSQAAISLKLKRLEARLGCRVLERTPRRVRLTQRGEIFLPAARDLLLAHERVLAGLADAPSRRLTVGISDHVAGPELPEILARLTAYDPALVIEMRIASSQDLVARFDAATLDAVVVRCERPRKGGLVLAEDRLGWFAAPGWQIRKDQPLRLATLAECCEVRTQAIHLLDEAGIAWTEVFIGGGAPAVGAAISAGLAVAVLAHRIAPLEAVDIGAPAGLPPLPPSKIVLHSRLTDRRACEALRIITDAIRSPGSRRLSLRPRVPVSAVEPEACES